MINHYPFLDVAESLDLKNRALAFKSRCITHYDNLFILGYPFYINSLKKSKRDPLSVTEHNTFMERNFPDILERIINYLEAKLGQKIFLDKRISYPGFHLIDVTPLSTTMINYHSDNESLNIKDTFPDLGILDQSEYSFTVLLDNPAGLTSGLSYLEGEVSIEKFKRISSNNSGKLFNISSFKKYELGDLILHQNLVHSLWGKNSSSKLLTRITFQGHLTQTKNGLLLFW